MTVDGKHRYVLFGVDDDQIFDPNGLRWQDIFSFLYKHYRPRTAFVGFFLGYDFTQIFATLPIDRAWYLLTKDGRALRQHKIRGKAPHPVECDGWQFDILGMKRLRIRPKTCDCKVATCKCKHAPWMYICDVGPFFQTAFLKVIDPKEWPAGTAIVTDVEYETIKRGKEKRSTAVLDDDMLMYNRLENKVLGRVMRQLDAGFHAIGVHLPPSKWFGPGQAAQAWLQKEGVPPTKDLIEYVPEFFFEAARMSYFGGWFEQFMHGIIPGDSHEYDINSAYPSVIEDLPCLLHGEYSHGEGLPPKGSGRDLTLVYGNVWSPEMPFGGWRQYIGAMLHRDLGGRIRRPMATEGWFWWDELKAAERAKMVKRLDNKGRQQITKWVRYEPCDCPPPMAGVRDLYLARLAAGKTSPLGKAAKLVYNAKYGKFAQSEGGIGGSLYGNPIYASRITSGCRRQIIDAIATHPKGKANVSMVATDAVYFLNPHPGLNVSEALGEWDYKVRTNLTLFKPGVYWDDATRREIASGDSPRFKARGFKAADFVASLGRVDAEYRRWADTDNPREWTWPRVTFVPSFSMTTALQALMRGKWETAGAVETEPQPLIQDSNPWQKRERIYRDEIDGRIVYRTRPHENLGWDVHTAQMFWIESTPYEKRFGLEDPWSEEYRSQYGMNDDGGMLDILAWILHGH